MSAFDRVGTKADWDKLPLEVRVFLANGWTAGALNFIDPWARCDVWKILDEEQKAVALAEMEIAGRMMKDLLKKVSRMYGVTEDNQVELAAETYAEERQRICKANAREFL